MQFNCPSHAQNPRLSYVTDPYASYYKMPDEGIVNRQIPREQGQRRAKQRLFGVRLGNNARAYFFQTLKQTPLIHDQLGGQPILVWFAPERETGAAYLRQVDGQTLTFSSQDGHRLVDEGTGSEWEAVTGTAVSGPLAGAKLSPLVSTTAFEFGWFDYFPQSDTYGDQ